MVCFCALCGDEARRTKQESYPALEGCVILSRLRSTSFLALLVAAAGGLAVATSAAAFASSGDYHPAPQGDLKLSQVNLASHLPAMAPVTDPDLKNPWGISLSATSPLWISNQGTDSSTLYSLAAGSSTATKSTAVRVTLPDSVAGPSGQVFNPSTGFVLSNGTASAP